MWMHWSRIWSEMHNGRGKELDAFSHIHYSWEENVTLIGRCVIGKMISFPDWKKIGKKTDSIFHQARDHGKIHNKLVYCLANSILSLFFLFITLAYGCCIFVFFVPVVVTDSQVFKKVLKSTHSYNPHREILFSSEQRYCHSMEGFKFPCLLMCFLSESSQRSTCKHITASEGEII